MKKVNETRLIKDLDVITGIKDTQYVTLKMERRETTWMGMNRRKWKNSVMEVKVHWNEEGWLQSVKSRLQIEK